MLQAKASDLFTRNRSLDDHIKCGLIVGYTDKGHASLVLEILGLMRLFADRMMDGHVQKAKRVPPNITSIRQFLIDF